MLDWLRGIFKVSTEIDIKEIAKLIQKGRVERAYEKIYNKAEELAINDTEHYMYSLGIEGLKEKESNEYNKNYFEDFALDVSNYRAKKLEEHLKRMLDLLNKKD